jgi:hypothetical protein
VVVAGGVDGELSDDGSGGGVQHGDVEVADEHQNVGSGVGAADADVVQSSGVTQGEASGVVDAVGADAVVAVGAVAGAGFGSGGVDGGGGGSVWQGASLGISAAPRPPNPPDARAGQRKWLTAPKHSDPRGQNLKRPRRVER